MTGKVKENAWKNENLQEYHENIEYSRP